ncbi:hypothetical protein [Aeromonas enteropelogenes]|uniref:hypothetical protein n=1 Tax=Aeromonas enteropelogenes TaxID=29489 RepID=UPI003BA2EBDF
MSTNGLADGFMAGFSMMDRYQRGQEADKRANHEMGLREQYRQAQMDNQAWQRQHTEDSDKYQRERDALADKNNIRDFDLRKRVAESQMANNAVNRQTNQFNLNRAKRSDQLAQQLQWLQANAPFIQQGYADIEQGKDPRESFWSRVNTQEGAQYNPLNWGGRERVDAANTIAKNVSPLMNMIHDGKLNWGREGDQKQIVEKINTPDNLAAVNTIFKDEINAGVGEVDPNTGKKIVGKQLVNILPTKDGNNLMLGLRVNYADGTSAMHPVTQNRSSEKDDLVKLIPWNKFLGTIYQRGDIAAKVMKDMPKVRAYYEQYLNSAMGKGKSGNSLRDALIKKQVDVVANPKMYAGGGLDGSGDPPIGQALAGLNNIARQNGFDLPQVQSGGGNGGGSDWGKGDPDKQNFLAAMEKNGIPLPTGPREKEAVYQKVMAELTGKKKKQEGDAAKSDAWEHVMNRR